MATAHGKLHAGVCGFVTEVNATCEDGQHVRIEGTSDCETCSKILAAVAEVDAFGELRAGYDGVIGSAARNTAMGCCAGCAIPAGIFKTMQIAAGLALPAPVHMEFERE